ncbi:hypothetical protein chiPu_0032827, partial [Chiloscyllium punctatum]|nr:hypothetical protein [Chiloscyllium punctatum]
MPGCVTPVTERSDIVAQFPWDSACDRQSHARDPLG